MKKPETETKDYMVPFPEALKTTRHWLRQFSKSGDKHDYARFTEWVRWLDPRLSKVRPDRYFPDFNLDRAALKLIDGRLGLLASDYERQDWRQFREDYSILLGMAFTLNYHYLGGWNPKDAAAAKKTDKTTDKTIMVQLRGNDTLSVRWAGDWRWAEVRGGNYWQYNPDDPLHQLIDHLTGNRSDLMNGTEIAVSSNYREYKELAGLLAEEIQ